MTTIDPPKISKKVIKLGEYKRKIEDRNRPYCTISESDQAGLTEAFEPYRTRLKEWKVRMNKQIEDWVIRMNRQIDDMECTLMERDDMGSLLKRATIKSMRQQVDKVKRQLGELG